MRGIAQRGEVHDEFALVAPLEFREELLRRFFVRRRERVEKVGVEIVLRPLLGALDQLLQGDGVLVRRARGPRHCEQQGGEQNAADSFHLSKPDSTRPIRQLDKALPYTGGGLRCA